MHYCKYCIISILIIHFHRGEEPVLSNMDISTGHMVLVIHKPIKIVFLKIRNNHAYKIRHAFISGLYGRSFK